MRPTKPRRRIFIPALLSITLILSICALILSRGITVDQLTIGQIQIEDISLRWSTRLDLTIDQLTWSPLKKSTSANIQLNAIEPLLHSIQRWSNLFTAITINSIQGGKVNGRLKYRTDQNKKILHLTGSYSDFKGRASLELQPTSWFLTIKEITCDKLNIQAQATARLNLTTNKITGSISANLTPSLPVEISFTADEKQLAFNGKGAASISTITPFVNLFGLDPDIQCWITEYLQAENYHLENVQGIIPWNDPLKIIDTFSARARVEDAQYVFSQGLQPITSKLVELTFEHGVLFIKPHQAFFCGQSCGTSHLSIDFNKPDDILLTLYLLLEAQLNDDILTLLKQYDIKPGLKQLSGTTNTDLKLTINLNKTDVESRGTFKVKKGKFLFDQTEAELTDAVISLVNSNIDIQQAGIQMEETLKATLSGKLNPETAVGDLDITLQKFDFKNKEQAISLNSAKSPLQLTYQIRPDGDSAAIQASIWNIDAVQIEIAALTIPIDLSSQSGSVPKTRIDIKPELTALVSGKFNLKEKTVDMAIDLTRYKTSDIHLAQPIASYRLTFADHLKIYPQGTHQWLINNVKTTFTVGLLQFINNKLSIKDGKIIYGDFFKSHFHSQYDVQTGDGTVDLSNLVITNKQLDKLLETRDKVQVKITNNKNKFLLNFPMLGLTIATAKNKDWSISCSDISKVEKISPLMQQYKLNKGSLRVSSTDGGMPYSFSGKLIYDYPLLVQNDTPVNEYIFSGHYTKKKIQATINNDFKITYQDSLHLSSSNLGYNIPAIVNLIKDQNSKNESENKPKAKDADSFQLELEATKSFLYLQSDSRISADTLKISSTGDDTEINLRQGPGKINFSLQGDKLTFSSEQLTDTFMNEVIRFSSFRGGRMSFAGKGTLDKFQAAIKVEGTTLSNYATLNNILAMVDTIPALITFSLPDYSKHGLKVNNAIVVLDFNQSIAHIKSFEINSTELDIRATGNVDLSSDQIDMDFNLITQAGQNISKIPLVGYILAGDKKRPTLTVKVTGDIKDPDVKSSAFKEISTMPFSMVFRTLSLPLHLMHKVFDSNSDTDSDGKKNKITSESEHDAL